MSADVKQQANHIWHVWMNQFAKEEKPWPHSLYEFKSLLQFLEYGHRQIADAFNGTLPKTHRQYSRAAPEPIQDNKLTCCLGKEVTTCPILVSIKTTFDAERQRECGVLGKHYAEVPDEEMYRVMAKTCAWHIYKGVTNGQEKFSGIDTTEGHLMTKGDRMFWDRVYQSMSDQPEDEPE